MKSAKTIVIVASVVFLTLSLAGHSAGKEAPTPKLPKLVAPTPKLPKLVAPAPKLHKLTAPTKPARITKRLSPIGKVIKAPEHPHKDSVILLEAFMVQVRLSALRSLGVPQISRGPDSISADHILKLLKDTDAAQVTAGAKLTVCQGSKGKTGSTARKGIYAGPPDHRKMEYVEVSTSFMAQAHIQPEQRIRVNLDFEHSDIEAGDGDADLVPPLVTRNWSLSLYLKDGKPTLVGAMQDGKIATFLIVTANIKK